MSLLKFIFFKKNEPRNALNVVFLNSLIFLIISPIITLCVFFLNNESIELSNIFFTTIFIYFLTFPFYLLITLSISMIIFFFLQFFVKDIKVSSFYVVMLTYFSLMLFFNAINLSLLLTYKNIFIISLLIFIISNTISIMVMYLGLKHYLKINNVLILIIIIISLILNIISFTMGGQ